MLSQASGITSRRKLAHPRLERKHHITDDTIKAGETRLAAGLERDHLLDREHISRGASRGPDHSNSRFLSPLQRFGAGEQSS